MKRWLRKFWERLRNRRGYFFPLSWGVRNYIGSVQLSNAYLRPGDRKRLRYNNETTRV